MVHQVKTRVELAERIMDAGDKLVVIDFFATWCGPCKRVAPLLETIAKEKGDKLVILKVDVDEVEELVSEYGIEVMPTFVFKRKGEHLDTLVGSNEDKLMELINRHSQG